MVIVKKLTELYIERLLYTKIAQFQIWVHLAGVQQTVKLNSKLTVAEYDLLRVFPNLKLTYEKRFILGWISIKVTIKLSRIPNIFGVEFYGTLLILCRGMSHCQMESIHSTQFLRRFSSSLTNCGLSCQAVTISLLVLLCTVI